MVLATDTVSSLADVIFAIEGTAINGVYLNDIKTNYLIPTLEYFSQGCLTEESYACDESSSALYGIVVYHAADRLPSPSTDIYGPYSNPQKLMHMLDKLELVGGRGESHANVAEALATSLVCFDDMQLRRDSNANPQKHCILICNSPPYLMPVAENQTYAGKTAEQLASLFSEKSVNLTILSARKIPAMFKLYEKAGGDLTSVQSKNYAKDPRHLVLLKGFSLKERPVSPVHPMTATGAVAAVGTPTPSGPRYPVYPQPTAQPRPTATHPTQRWPRPPPAFPQAPAPSSSALIEQLTRPPSAIGPQFGSNSMTIAQQQAQMRIMASSNPAMAGTMTSQGQAIVNVPPNMATTASMVPGGVMGPGSQNMLGGGMMTAAQQSPGSMMVQNPNQSMMVQMQQPGVLGNQGSMLQPNPPASMMSTQPTQPMQQQGMRESITIWQGVIEWLDKAKNSTDGPKITRQVPCQVSAQPKDGEPELKADGWPNKLIMQLMPRSLITTIGGSFIKNSKSVVFHLQPCENLDVLTKVMSSGFAGCVHFNPVLREVKVLLMLYTPDRQAFLGFIPNDQTAFVDKLRKIIQTQQQKSISNRALVGAGGALGGPGNMLGAGMQPGAAGMQPGMQPGPNRMQPSMAPGTAGLQPGMSPGTAGMQPGLQGAGGIQPGMAPGGTGMQGGFQQAAGLQSGMPTSAAGMQPGLQSGPAGMQSGLQAAAGGLQGSMQPGMQPGLQPGAGGMQPGMQGGQQDQNGQNNQFTEAARQENLKQIQRLQMALEAAQQQEMQCKQLEMRNQIKIQQYQDPSQMPQQVLYEEQNKLRAQLQIQQGNQQRMMRPNTMPNNLKLLLQQGHYRVPVGQQMRPGMQPQQQQAQPPQQQQQQQFDDVSYEFLHNPNPL